MKILHLIQRPQLRGAEVFASQIGEVHHQQGHEVLFVALFPATGQIQLSLNGPGLQVLDLDPKRRIFDLSGWKRLAKVIRDFQPDIVQANAADTLKYAVFSRSLFGWPGKLVFRNANKTSDFIDTLPKKVFNRWLAHRSDFVASVSRNCELDYQELFGISPTKTETLTIGTPIPDPHTIPAAEEIIKNNRLPDNQQFIINIGSFVPEKNHPGLIDIFAQIHRALPNTGLILIGDGKLRAAIEQKIKDHQLQGSVHLLGYRSDATTILSACDLMLMPSFIEGMPGVILEAMARKVPVIASEVGGINEIIEHEKTGFLGNPSDPETFIRPAISLLQDKNKRQFISDAAFAFCQSTKSIEVIAERFLNCYKKLTHS